MMTKHFKMRAVAVAVASSLSFVPLLAEAAGLGRITVLSGFGQPLRAEVEITATAAELSGMSARLAPASAFREAGMDLAPSLLDFRFSVEKRGGKSAVVKVTSARPVVDPIVGFLVELSWPAGQIVREYTFLLDPPEVAARAAAGGGAAVDASAVDATRGTRPAAAPASASAPVVAAPKSGGDARKADAPGTHVVQQGETLRRIAGDTRHDGVTLEQMMVGLFRNNQKAFVADNMNRMKAGAILNIPDKATVAAVPAAEARNVYVAQAGEWNKYRQGVAAAAPMVPEKAAEVPQAAAGKVTPRVEEKAAPSEQARDQVKVARTEAAGKGAAGGKSVTAIEEELVAKDQALKEAQERLTLLEKNVADLQKLVDMKTQRLAELQAQVSGKEAPPAVPAAPIKPAEPAPAAEPPKAAEPAKPAEAVKPAEPEKPAEPAKPVAEAKPAEAPKPAEAKPAEAPAPAAAESEGLLSDPLTLIGGGGILALLAGYFLMRRRRATESAAEAPTMAAPAPSSLGPNSVFRMTGGQSVDTANLPVQTADFSQTGPGTIDTDEVDPVAEADVYMAYGRDAQAEEILVEAQRKDPQRLAIQVKLLEIYANRKSIKQFDTLASDLYAQTGGSGPEWDKVVALGAALVPENPLYAGGRAARAGEATAEPAQAPGSATVVLPGTLGAMAAASGAAAAFGTLEADAQARLAETEVMPGLAETHVIDFDIARGATDQASFAETVVAPVPLPEIETISFDLAQPAPEPAYAPEETIVASVPVAEPDLGATIVVGDAATSLTLPDFDFGIAPSGTETVVNPETLNEALSGELGVETVVDPFALQNVEARSGADETMIDPGLIHEAMTGELTIVDGSAGMNFVPGETSDAEKALGETMVFGEPLPVAGDFDMTNINLDLGAVPAPADETQFMGLPLEQPEEPGAGGEAGTKLALAQAYEEMGDRDQARELLEEVIAEGAGEAADKARQMIDRLRG